MHNTKASKPEAGHPRDPSSHTVRWGYAKAIGFWSPYYENWTLGLKLQDFSGFSEDSIFLYLTLQPGRL